MSQLTKTELLAWTTEFYSRQDIRFWYSIYADRGCPNCGADFTKFGDQQNIYPHFTGACKEQTA